MSEKSGFTLLVQRAQAGDYRSFDLLAARFRVMAITVAMARLGGDSLCADDAAQEALIEAWEYLPRLEHPTAFPAILRRMVVKQCDRILRRTSSREITGVLSHLTLPDQNSDPANAVILRDEAHLLRKALTRLSLAEREVLLLHYVGESPLSEIAQLLDVSPAAVKSRLYRARQRLRGEIIELETGLREIFRDYQKQVHRYATTPPAERGSVPQPNIQLLERACRRVQERLADPALLDAAMVRLAESVLHNGQDHTGLLILFDRYLSQSLSTSEELWSRWYRLRSLAHLQRHADTVEEHRHLLDLGDSALAIGFVPHLSQKRPYWPGYGTPMSESAFRLWLLAASFAETQVVTAWGISRQADEWIQRAEAVLAMTPATPDVARMRSDVRTSLLIVRRIQGRSEDRVDILRGYAEATAQEGDSDRSRTWSVQERIARTQQAARSGDADALRREAEALADLVLPEPPGDFRRAMAGHCLVFVRQYDLAEQIMRPWIDHARIDWPQLIDFAAVVWKAQGDKPEAIALLRQAVLLWRNAVLKQPSLERNVAWIRDLADIPEFDAVIRDEPGLLSP